MPKGKRQNDAFDFLRRDRGPTSEGLANEPSDSFLIVVEGRVSERCYFESLRRRLSIPTATVRVVPSKHPDPVHLVTEARKMFEADNQGRKRSKLARSERDALFLDQVWAVFDSDVDAAGAKLHEAVRLAKQAGIRLGLSSPSVEFWFLLHFADRCGALLTAKAAGDRLSEAWGADYDKSEGVFWRLWSAMEPRIGEAVRRAKKTRTHHTTSGSQLPAGPSTDVDLLVSALNASLRRYRRLF